MPADEFGSVRILTDENAILEDTSSHPLSSPYLRQYRGHTESSRKYGLYHRNDSSMPKTSQKTLISVANIHKIQHGAPSSTTPYII